MDRVECTHAWQALAEVGRRGNIPDGPHEVEVSDAPISLSRSESSSDRITVTVGGPKGSGKTTLLVDLAYMIWDLGGAIDTTHCPDVSSFLNSNSRGTRGPAKPTTVNLVEER